MADSFEFIGTDSAEIYTTVLESLMDSCGEALYPGDERRIFAEGLVAVLVSAYSLFDDRAKQRTLRYARGAVLDAIAERYRVERLAPSGASATFRFSVSAIQAENIIIPAGTRITPDGTVYFATHEAAVLPMGEAYVDLEAVCADGGSAYNGYSAGSIATLVDLIPYIGTVQNITVSDGGDDGEPYTEEGDERLRERIRLAPAALSTAGPESAYRYFALSADPGIVDVAIDCPADSPNVVNIYPLMDGGEIPGADTLQKVVDVLGDDVRPLTDNVNVLAPDPVDFALNIKYYCSKGDEAAIIQAIEGDGGAISKYLDWQTAALARAIDPDQLRRFVFEAWASSGATGTVRIDIASPSYKDLTKMQFARLSGSPTVSHEVVAV